MQNLALNQRIKLDFETRSRVDVTNVGAYRYGKHPSTTVLCFAYIYPENPNKSFLWTPEHVKPTKLISELLRDDRGLEAHNAGFEFAIWNYVLVPKFGFPPLPANKFYCSAAKAAQCALPSKLEKAAQALELPYQKDMEGHRVMLKLSKPRKPSKKNPKPFHELRDDFQKMYNYCRMDTLVELELTKRLPDLPDNERKIWLLDQEMNRRGVTLDVEAAVKARDILLDGKTKLESEFLELTEGIVSTPKSPKLKDYMNETFHLEMPNMQAATVAEWLKVENIPDEARRILEIKQTISKSSTAKLDKMLDYVSIDDRIRDYLFYHAATTGRWGGRGIQPQNFPRGHLKYDQVVECIDDIKRFNYDEMQAKWGSPFAAISSCLRGLLMAAPNHKLRAADYSAIEARGVAWLAGEDKALAIFHNDGCIYTDMACDIYGITPDEIDFDKRQMGKQAILGLGYGMGAEKFVETLAGYGIHIELAEAKKIVKIYRKKYAKIVQFWYDLEAACVNAIQYRKVFRCGKIQVGVKGDFLMIRLPSGRFLYYYRPHLVKRKTPWGEDKYQMAFYGTDSQKGGHFTRQFTYGGKLVENVTQATARDVMAFNMLNTEKEGFKLLFTVHDELISENEIGFKSLEEFERSLEIVPKWANGFPIAAEGWEGDRYRKG